MARGKSAASLSLRGAGPQLGQSLAKIQAVLLLHLGAGGHICPIVSPQPARAPTHHEARVAGEPGRCVRGQQGPASHEAGVGRPPQQPQGGADHALAGEGGGQQAQLRPAAEGEPAQGCQGATWGPAGRPRRPTLVLALTDAGRGATSNGGTAGDRRPRAHPCSALQVLSGVPTGPSARRQAPDPDPRAVTSGTPLTLCPILPPTPTTRPPCPWSPSASGSKSPVVLIRKGAGSTEMSTVTAQEEQEKALAGARPCAHLASHGKHKCLHPGQKPARLPEPVGPGKARGRERPANE